MWIDEKIEWGTDLESKTEHYRREMKIKVMGKLIGGWENGCASELWARIRGSGLVGEIRRLDDENDKIGGDMKE